MILMTIKNKNRMILIATSIVIGLFFIINFLVLFIPLNLDSIRYWLLILTYVLVTIILYLEKGNLTEFHIDRYSIVILITFGTIFHRRLLVPFEIFYQIILWILCVSMLYYLIKNWNSIPGMNLREFIISNLVIVIFLVFINLLKNSLNLVPSYSHDQMPIMYVLRDLILEFSFIAPMEEFLFRGVLWGLLNRYGLNLRKVMVIQGLVFWALHFRSESQVVFFIILPICTAFYSFMTVKFRRLFPAILSHALVNAVCAYL